MRLFAALLVAFILFSSPLALGFSVSLPDTTFIVPTTSQRQIDITLLSPMRETVAINVINSRPWLTLVTQQLELQPNNPVIASIVASPSLDTPAGIYKFSMLFESLTTGDLKKGDVFVSVERREVVDLQKISVTGDLYPTGYANIELTIKNLKSVTVQDVAVSINVYSSTRNAASVTRRINKLDPNQETSITIPIYFERLTPAETYTIDGSVTYKEEVIRARQTFDVVARKVIDEREETKPTIFGSIKKITITNNGNELGYHEVRAVVTPLESIFFRGDNPAYKDGNVYVWKVKDIVPGETRAITYSIDYSPVFYFIIALAAVLWFFFYKYRTVRVRKYILQKKSLEEGEEFTVAIEVKNALGKQISCEIHDFVPSVFNVKDMEGVKPHKKKSNIGMELEWHVGPLKPGEERIFTYRISPIFGIHGTIKLPRAFVTFEYNRKKWENKSLSPSVGIPEENGEEERLNSIFRKKK